MNTHVKVVAVLHIALGVIGLIGAMIVLAIFGLAGGIAFSQGERGPAGIIGLVALCIGAFIVLLSIPGIIAGWGLLAQKSWARVLMIVIGALNLLNIPFGTALGVYTIWALINDDRLQVTRSEVTRAES
jgi:hypothetical protein